MVKMIEDTITRDKNVLKIVVVISVNEETIIILTLTIELRLKVKMFKLQEVGKSKDKVVVGATEVRLAN